LSGGSLGSVVIFRFMTEGGRFARRCKVRLSRSDLGNSLLIPHRNRIEIPLTKRLALKIIQSGSPYQPVQEFCELFLARTRGPTPIEGQFGWVGILWYVGEFGERYPVINSSPHRTPISILANYFRFCANGKYIFVAKNQMIRRRQSAGERKMRGKICLPVAGCYFPALSLVRANFILLYIFSFIFFCTKKTHFQG